LSNIENLPDLKKLSEQVLSLVEENGPSATVTCDVTNKPISGSEIRYHSISRINGDD